MPVVLDAFALVALALDEPAAAEVEDLLRSGHTRMSVVNVCEAIDQLYRTKEQPFSDLREGFDTLESEVIDFVAPDSRTAWRAAELRSRHYKRRKSELSLADCFALALSDQQWSLATADPPLARAARSEGIEVIALPDSSGHRP